MRRDPSDRERVTVEDMLVAARFVGRMSDDEKQSAEWMRWLLHSADLLQHQRLRARCADPLLGGGSLGDLCAALSPPGAKTFDSHNQRDLRALSVVASVLAENSETR
jgi:hypothetical protein